jgi:glutathione S-transferase
MAEEVKVFRSWSSPFPLRVIWALRLKGVKFDVICEDLFNKSPLLLQYNPVGKKVPVLVHNGKAICESLVILEYIEETWKQTPLLPEDPYQKANARFWAKFSDDKVIMEVLCHFQNNQRFLYGPISHWFLTFYSVYLWLQVLQSIKWDVLLKEGKEQEEGILASLQNLRYLEEELRGKKFFGGEAIGLADLALGWLAYYLNIFEEVAGLKLVDQESFPSLVAWMQDFANAPVVHGSWPDKDKLAEKFVAMREASLGKETHK